MCSTPFFTVLSFFPFFIHWPWITWSILCCSQLHQCRSRSAAAAATAKQGEEVSWRKGHCFLDCFFLKKASFPTDLYLVRTENQQCLPCSSLCFLQKGQKWKKKKVWRANNRFFFVTNCGQRLLYGRRKSGIQPYILSDRWSRRCFIIFEMMQTGWGRDAENRVAALNGVFFLLFMSFPVWLCQLAKACGLLSYSSFLHPSSTTSTVAPALTLPR